MHNSCVLHFFYLCSKNPLGRGWNVTWSFGKVICSKSMKIVFLARIIRHKLCIIYAFFDFLCSKITFDHKLFSYCRDKCVYLSCWFSFTFPEAGIYTSNGFFYYSNKKNFVTACFRDSFNIVSIFIHFELRVVLLEGNLPGISQPPGSMSTVWI